VAAAIGLAPHEVLDLSASLNPVAPPVTDVVGRHLGALSRYPDPTGATEALASALAVDPARVLLTNGGAEAISLVGAVLGGTVDEPDFSLYPRTGSGPRWRSNPHSPSGAIEQLPPSLDADTNRTEPTQPASTARGTVWDEAFWPLATGTWSRRDFDRGDVVVGSLTKLFSCPGLRVGYVVVPDGGGPLDGPTLHRSISERQPHWSVGGLACAALAELLASADLPRWAAQVAELRLALVELLAGHGLRADAGAGPWILTDAPPGLRQRLAAEGVVVRDCTSFGRPGTVRFAVPRRDQFDRLDRALEIALHPSGPDPLDLRNPPSRPGSPGRPQDPRTIPW
jgi:histidinol-phosphate/aromatic aminotransferase/cobyric acid decarboxylase-like protein